MMNDLIKITGLWLNRTKDGRDYFSGRFGDARILIFENRERASDKMPTHTLFIAPSMAKVQQDQGSRQESPTNSYKPSDNDVPF